MEYETRYIKAILVPKGEPIFSDFATEVEIDYEAAGEFLIIRQTNDDVVPGEIRINGEEWPQLRELIDLMCDKLRAE